MSAYIPPRTPTPYYDSTGPELVALYESNLQLLDTLDNDNPMRQQIEQVVTWVKDEAFERFYSFVRADDDGFADDADLRQLARGAGILEPASQKTEESEARRQVVEVKREQRELKSTVSTLQKRAQIDSSQIKILRNRSLGQAATTASALVPILIDLTSKRPSRPGAPAKWRLPLDRIADVTGASTDTCARHLKQLASYTDDNGNPLIYHEVIDIPPGTDLETGEITGAGIPRKATFIGTDASPEKLAEILATFVPEKKSNWGGKRDVVCPDHPEAGVIKRVKHTVATSFECAECHAELQKTTTVIGHPTAETMPEIPAHEVAGWLDGTDEAPTPIRQVAASTDVNTKQEGVRDVKSSGNLRHGATAQPLFTPSGPTADEIAEGLAAWNKPASIDPLTDPSIGAKHRQRPAARSTPDDSYDNSRIAQSCRRDSLANRGPHDAIRE